MFGADVLYHYTVTEQAIEKGQLSNENNLAVCYEGVKGGHPKGFYIIPYVLGTIIGLNIAFIVIPIIIGLLGLLAGYFLIKQIFNRKIALITLFFSAISLAHISKSFPFSYRGENLIYPLLALSLFFLYKAYEGKKKNFAITAGLLSGTTMWLWNGYPVVIIIFLACAGSYLSYQYLRKYNKILIDIKITALSIIMQALVMTFIALTATLWGKGEIFWQQYYLLVFSVSVMGLAIAYFSIKKKTHLPLVILAIIGVVTAIFFIPQIKEIASGFGTIQAHNVVMSPELLKPQPNQLFFAFHILLLTSILGIISFIKRFEERKAFFLGLLVPSAYMLISATRYVYFATLPIIALTALFLDNKKIVGKKFDIFAFLTATLMILLFIYSFYAIPRFYSENIHIKEVEPYEFLREKSEKNACVMDISSRGATVEFFAKRYFFFHSLGYHDERYRIAANVLLKGETSEITIENFYILLNYADMMRINLANGYANMSDIGFYRIATDYGSEGINSAEIRESLDFMRAIFIDDKLYINNSGKGCTYITNIDAFYFKDGVCDTPMYRMVTNQSVENFTSVYFEKGYSIYKYTPTTNLVKKE